MFQPTTNGACDIPYFRDYRLLTPNYQLPMLFPTPLFFSTTDGACDIPNFRDYFLPTTNSSLPLSTSNAVCYTAIFQYYRWSLRHPEFSGLLSLYQWSLLCPEFSSLPMELATSRIFGTTFYCILLNFVYFSVNLFQDKTHLSILLCCNPNNKSIIIFF